MRFWTPPVFRPRRRSFRSVPPLVAAVFLLACLSRASAQVSVLTNRNDIARTGQNTAEATLNRANVKSATFGLLFKQAVDGYVYAQPLIVPNVVIPGKGTHNVVFIATEHDSVYAFDADNNTGANANPLWHTSFLNLVAGVTSVPNGDTGSSDIVPEVGITGTPVIDALNGILYVLAKTKEKAGNNFVYVQRLHALNIQTGADMPGGPIVIQASVPGVGDGNDGMGHVPFDPLRQHNRPALLLLNGVVYIAWASHGDNTPYHGWVMGYQYNGNALTQVSVINVSPNARTDPSGYPIGAVGIWMSGNGLAADATGNIYFETGNGTFDANAGGHDFGDSFVKLGTNGGLAVADYYTPSNQDALNRSDNDLGSGGCVLLPDAVGSVAHPHLLVGSGKPGNIYLVDRDNMGHFNPNADNIVQLLPGVIGGAWSSPAYFNNKIYYQGTGDVLKAFSIANAKLSSGPVSQSATAFGYPGATPSISANGNVDGIAWVIESTASATLHAYNADNLGQELYNTNQAGNRDRLGGYVKFTVPTIANGKVYVGTQSGLYALGLQAATLASLTIAPPSVVGGAGNTATGTVTLTSPAPVNGAQVSLSSNNAAASVPANVMVAQGATMANFTINTTAVQASTIATISATYGTTKNANLTVLPQGGGNALKPVADAYVRSGQYSNTNYGAQAYLVVGTSAHNNTSNSNYAAYLKFDLTQVNAALANATLTLTVVDAPPAGESVNVNDIADTAWTEQGITYNNAPGLNGPTFTSTGTLVTSVVVPPKSTQIAVDLTAYVKAHAGQVVTLQLIDPNAESLFFLAFSREAGSGQPTLTIK